MYGYAVIRTNKEWIDNMAIKLIACDLDGTLMNSRVDISDENIAAIERLIKAGYYFIPASGRSTEQIPQKLLDVKGIDYLVTTNGAFVTRLSTKEVIFESAMSPEQTEEILRVATQSCAFMMVYTPDGIIVNSDTTAVENLSEFTYMRDALKLQNAIDNVHSYYLEKHFDVFKIVLFFSSLQHEHDTLSKVKDLNSYEISVAAKNNVEITANGINKAIGLEALIKHLGITADEIITIGDSGNDVHMLRMTPNSYAVANAMQSAKDAAFNLTVSNDEHVIHTIENMLLC